MQSLSINTPPTDPCYPIAGIVWETRRPSLTSLIISDSFSGYGRNEFRADHACDHYQNAFKGAFLHLIEATYFMASQIRT